MATVAPDGSQPLQQNWIVGRTTDLLLIVAAPVVALAWSIAIYLLGGPSTVWAVFMVFNVAHHFPTFIRIYGDRDCFRRFRWSLVLGPVLPFTVAMLVAGYVVTDPDPGKQITEKFGHLIFLWMILTLWDPWHFLMQHYGFMRIYDRHNQAPRKLASWMDYLISATWFVFIMTAAVQWFCGEVLYTLYNNHGMPLLLWINAPAYRLIVGLAFTAAAVMTMVYVAYVIWCRAKGYFVSYVKLTLLLVTFGVMYLTYLPDTLIGRFLPNWTYMTGFATLGMVHVTQYLAIVWKYNRSLAKQGKRRARSGWFTSAFAKGGLMVAASYVIICLLYGASLSDEASPVLHIGRALGLSTTTFEWVFATMWAVSFTSTFTHYYYDGFIWKVRHKENQEALAMRSGQTKTGDDQGDQKKSPVSSWWERGKQNTPGATFLRQLAYFGIPFALLIYTYAAMGEARRMPLKQIQSAHRLSISGQSEEARELAQQSLAEIDNQKKVVATVAELDHHRKAGHLTYLADLTYASAIARFELMAGKDAKPSVEQVAEHRQQVAEAIRLLQQALEVPGAEDFGHREASSTRQDVEERIQLWSKQLAELSTS